MTDPDDIVECIEKLSKQIAAALKNPSDADNPISASVDLQALKASSDPNARSDARILEAVQSLTREVTDIEGNLFALTSERNPSKSTSTPLPSASTPKRAYDEAMEKAMADLLEALADSKKRLAPKKGA